MKTSIIVSNKGRQSVKEIIKACNNPELDMYVRWGKDKKRWYRYSLDGLEKIDGPPVFRNQKIIRYGNCILLNSKGCIYYNKSKAIALAASKGACRFYLQDKMIDVPTTWSFGQQMEYPVIARCEKHFGGKKFWICYNLDQVKRMRRKGASYFSAIYPKTKEYRVHCAHGKVICVQEKPAPANPKAIAWNRNQTDEDFRILKWEEFDIDILTLALNATKALDLDFSAVDVLAYPEGDEDLPKAVICELNTGARLSGELMIEKYSKYFNWLAKTDEAREHFDYSQWKKPRSFSWKNKFFSDNYKITKKDEINV